MATSQVCLTGISVLYFNAVFSAFSPRTATTLSSAGHSNTAGLTLCHHSSRHSSLITHHSLTHSLTHFFALTPPLYSFPHSSSLPHFLTHPLALFQHTHSLPPTRQLTHSLTHSPSDAPRRQSTRPTPRGRHEHVPRAHTRRHRGLPALPLPYYAGHMSSGRGSFAARSAHTTAPSIWLLQD